MSHGSQTCATAGVKRRVCDSAKALRAYLCFPTNDQLYQIMILGWFMDSSEVILNAFTS
jgi:hypothetical protein